MKIKAKYKSVSFLLATIISVSFLSPVGAYAATPVFGSTRTRPGILRYGWIMGLVSAIGLHI